MFTGIIEEVGKVTGLVKKKENLELEVECTFVGELKVDQSISHNVNFSNGLVVKAWSDPGVDSTAW